MFSGGYQSFCVRISLFLRGEYKNKDCMYHIFTILILKNENIFQKEKLRKLLKYSLFFVRFFSVTRKEKGDPKF